MNRRFLLAAFLLAASARGDAPLPARYRLVGEPRSEEAGGFLDAPVVSFRAAGLPAAAAFLSVSRSYGVTFVLDPAVKGDVTLEVRGGTVRDLIDALAKSQGCCWERQGRLVVIRKAVIRFFEIDYPQMTRSAQGSSSVVLSAQAISGAGLSSAGASAAAPSAPFGAGGSGSNDQTNLSIQQQNQTTFWTDLLAELTAMVQPGETVAVNKLAGVAVVSASPARQEDFKSFIAILNRRISQQVRISARVLEVNLDSQHELGIDWALVGATAGPAVLGAATRTAFSTLGGQALVPPTVSGTIGAGKLSAVVKALAEEGEVRAVSNPSVVSLSNQTAFVKVGTEQTFFSLANATTINAAGTAVSPVATTQSNYAQNAITIGTVLYVTPEVNSDGTVTVDVLPAITQLIGIDSSPDGQQTAPRMDIKALSTIARLHSGESVMIGGLIEDRTSRQVQKTPGLSAIPLVGSLFATSAHSATRSELVIFLSAEVVR